jgi:hypothetical protein
MIFYRLYAGDDGQSHFEELEKGQSSDVFFMTHPAKGLVFKNDHPTHILGFHNAPRRQWVITLSGSVDIGLGDGTIKTFGPGDVFLAEDVTGQGHTATPKNWARAFIHLE